MTARRPAGLALAALSGQYPEPALGLVPSAGPSLYDDFLMESDHITGIHGTIHGAFWHETTLGGAAATYTSSTPTAATEFGVLQVATAANANSGSVISYNASYRPIYRTFPDGFVWAVKLRMSASTANYYLWSGFADTLDIVSGATSNDFVGVRAEGANLFGVVREGTTETTVDFGFSCESGYKIVGFEVIDGEIQFFALDCSDDGLWERTEYGDPIAQTANEDLFPIALGIYTTTAATKTALIDWWAMGGRCAR